MLPKAIPFDLDDTIISYNGAADLAWKKVCISFVRQINAEFNADALLGRINEVKKYRLKESTMADYVMELRKLVGTRPLIMPGANVIILDREGKILLHHRSDMDLWGLPGGFCELGETVEETAAREVFEEVGLTCKCLKLFNVYSGEKQHFKYPHGDEVYNVTVTFICDDFTGDINVDKNEGRDARFFSCDQMPINIAAGIKVILDDFIMMKTPYMIKTSEFG